MSVSLPERSEAIGFRHYHGLDDVILLKLRMPVEGTDELISTSPFKDMVLSTTEKPITMQHSKLEWWNVDSVKNYRSGEADLPDAKRLHILIDYDQPGFAIVYLEWWET